MTTKTEKKPEPPKQVEQSKDNYSCQIVLEKTTREKAQDRSLPTDAFNVVYIVDGKEHLDVTRSEKMVNVFDMYYDRYGKDVVQKITYGHGTIRPNLWGAQPTEKKKRRKG